MSLDTGKSTPSRAFQENLAGWKAKANRLETERNKLRELLNEANADARVMDAQLTGITETLTRVARRAERLASVDPTDPVRAGRAAQARDDLTTIETILGSST